MRILTLHSNLPRYWLKLSTCYRTASPPAAYRCLRQAQEHTTTTNANHNALVEKCMEEFLQEHPAFRTNISLDVENKNCPLIDEPPDEREKEFIDLGTSQRAREMEDAFLQRQGPPGTAAAMLSDPQLFISGFETKWLNWRRYFLFSVTMSDDDRDLEVETDDEGNSFGQDFSG